MAFLADTYKWDTPSGEDVPWVLCWSYSDDGVELVSKVLRKIRAKGKFTSATVSAYAVTSDSTIDIDDLISGANPLFVFALDDSTDITQYGVRKIRGRNMLMYTIRLFGVSNYDGADGTIPDTLEEIALLLDVAGQER